MTDTTKPLMNKGDATASVNAGVTIFRKHWPIVVGCIVLSTGLSLVYSKTQQRVYQATAMIEIDPSVTGHLGDKEGTNASLGLNYFDNREYFETQYKIITSSQVMLAAARDSALVNEYDFFHLKEAPKTSITVETAAAALTPHVIVEPVRSSRLALVKIDDTDPKRAARLANAVVEAYIDQNLQRAVNSTSDAVEWLGTQVDHVKKDLEGNENSLHDFKEKNDLPSISINETSNMIRQEMLDYNTDLSHTRAKKKELEARRAGLTKVLAEDPENLPASELLNSGFLQKIRTEYQEAKRMRKALLAEGFGENHPKIKSADEKLSETRGELIAEIKNIQGAVERDLANITREEAGKSGLYEGAHKRAVELNMKEIEYHRLDRTRDQNEKLYAMLLEHMKQADLSRMMRVNNVRMVERATPPGSPIRPRTSTNLGLGIFLGVLIGLALAWLREVIDNRIKTPDDVEQELGVTFLGLLPEIDGAFQTGKKGRLQRRTAEITNKPELIVHDKPLSGLAEAARSIRTNLLFTNPDKPYRRLLVTSSAPSEGKTTVACSIAIALAQSGQRVCIVDCDLRRPRLHRVFDRVGDMGLTNVLVGEASIDDVALPTKVQNLSCVPSGPIPPNPADVLQSERFRRFLDKLSEKFDRVILDSPPLVAVTDSAIVSTMVDGTVFVMRAYSTTRSFARQGLRVLADVDAPIAGAVLNAVDFDKLEYNQYHYYYYKKEGYASINLPVGDDPGTGDFENPSTSTSHIDS